MVKYSQETKGCVGGGRVLHSESGKPIADPSSPSPNHWPPIPPLNGSVYFEILLAYKEKSYEYCLQRFQGL